MRKLHGQALRLMDFVVLPLQAALCSTLVAAMAGKIADWETSIKWFAQLGVRRPRPFLIATLVIEAAVMAVTAGAPAFGALAGLGFIAGATVVLYLAKGKGLDCSCFGPGHRVTTWSFVRNGLIAAGFLVLAVIAGAAAPDTIALVVAIAVAVPASRAVLAIRTLERVT